MPIARLRKLAAKTENDRAIRAMLVLSRKAGEKIAIGDNVVLVVVDCGNGRAA